MSLTRKLTAAGLPVAAAAVLAALALTGQPASAAETAGTPTVAPLAIETCSNSARDEEPVCADADYYGGEDDGAGESPVDGNDDGYGGVDNTPTTPAPKPTATYPGGVSPDEVPVDGPGTGAGAGDELPLTGSPVTTVAVVGLLLAGAGFAARFAARRRRA